MSAVLKQIDTSPEATAARRARIAAANEAHLIRAESLFAARRIVAKHKVRGPWELLQALQNIQQNFQGDSIGQEFNERLSELITDLDAVLVGPEPELQAFGPRGEYDMYTVGLKRGAA